MSRADLTFNIVEAHLTGKIDGVAINARANSGGRGGSKVKGAQNYFLVNNPLASKVKLSEKDPASVGGTLPMGRYLLRLHEKRHNWIRLIPDVGNAMHGRAGFAIHGQGKRGSDGCIVPTDFNIVLRLCKLVAARQKSGAPEVMLDVVAIGSEPDAKMKLYRSLA